MRRVIEYKVLFLLRRWVAKTKNEHLKRKEKADHLLISEDPCREDGRLLVFFLLVRLQPFLFIVIGSQRFVIKMSCQKWFSQAAKFPFRHHFGCKTILGVVLIVP